MQKDKSIIELIKLWDVYCKFTNKEICKKNTNLYIINHYFLNPVKPTYSSLKILKDLQNLSIKKRLVYRIKFYYDLFKFLFIKINLSRNQYQKNTCAAGISSPPNHAPNCHSKGPTRGQRTRSRRFALSEGNRRSSTWV